MFATDVLDAGDLAGLSRDFDVSPSPRRPPSIWVVCARRRCRRVRLGPCRTGSGDHVPIRAASLLLVPPTLGVALAPTFDALLVCRLL